MRGGAVLVAGAIGLAGAEAEVVDDPGAVVDADDPAEVTLVVVVSEPLFDEQPTSARASMPANTNLCIGDLRCRDLVESTRLWSAPVLV
ncbi:hypothetical protein [Antrihabitans sp. YC2-6]|uniref:hypothetical protein n=1 Tax=Antrihabitans sp. YC2-6 TaxID=2799498 RepID=UPI0018F38FB7|nr:hypothetical protein [Antrihabitans sp. YC2-6]MBJ8344687.1 hypothetical protein [Antrihabitans sp. YC2-6]